MAIKISGDLTTLPSILNKWAAEQEAKIAAIQRNNQRSDRGNFAVEQITRKEVITSSSTIANLASTLPILSGVFTYTSVANTSVTWNWSSLQLLYPNGETLNLGSGSNTVTGLTAGTYYFYPYYSTQRLRIEWVSISGSSIGTAPIAFTAKSLQASQHQNLDANVPLTTGGISAVVNGVGAGGGGGGGSSCVASNQLLEVQGRGFLRADELRVGDVIRSASDWTEIVAKGASRQNALVRITVSDGQTQEELETSISHPFKVADGTYIRAEDLSLTDSIISHKTPLAIVKVELVKEPSRFWTFHCEPNHEFSIGKLRAVTHNTIISK